MAHPANVPVARISIRSFCSATRGEEVIIYFVNDWVMLVNSVIWKNKSKWHLNDKSTLTCTYPYELCPFLFSEACCWRRNQSCSVCYSRGDLTCTESRNLPSDPLLTWNKSSVRGSRNSRRYWPISVHLMFLISEMEVKSFARCKAVHFDILPLTWRFVFYISYVVVFCKFANISPQYEMEEQRRLEDEKNVPEFVRVKENLRRIQLTE